MKTLITCFTSVLALSLLLCGCSKQEGAVKTDQLSSAFSSADSSIKKDVDAAIASVKAGDYAAAASKLQSISSHAKLTPEQDAALKEVISQVKAKISEMSKEAVKDAAKDAGKAADDAAKAAKDTAKKVGEGASKAADDVKNLIKK